MKEDIKQLLKKPIHSVKGIGETREKHFHKLNIFTVEDIITHYPREYEDRSRLKNIAQLENGESCSFVGVVAARAAESSPRKGLTIYKLRIKDETGIINAVWYNQHFIKNVFKPGERYIFFGKIIRQYNGIEVHNPVYEKLDGSELKNSCRIIPVYPATASLTQNIIRSTIKSALQQVVGSLEDVLPLWVRSRYQLSEINYSIQNIHFPTSEQDFKNARKRLVFEELLILQLALLNIKETLNDGKSAIEFRHVPEMEGFKKLLPFKLTNAQAKVLEEIERDMESPRVMNRLVQGDVGSGKTIVAVLALYKAVKNGYQGALMVPTEILAEQHFSSVSALLGMVGIKVSLLVGSQTKKKKNEILNNLKEGNIDIIIGTHALIEEAVEFKKLGLVVTDEQHRFGVRQRAILSNKGQNPDVLVMTATPIPRTLALILYGDLDISIIDELPPGRKPIETYSVDNNMRERINGFIRKSVAEGRQAYIVCPLVEESETIEAKSAAETAERIANVDFKDLNVALIHGKMKAAEKDKVMKAFAEGSINILVSTTVIEVGVNVPNATVMVIENAERFGLAQLHQLRGRVGRGEHQSYCILYNEGKSKISKERMTVMKATNDGFVISEKDLELRGPGEFFGTRQHGLPELKIANLYRDMEILKKSQEAAMEIIQKDKTLSLDENFRLKQIIVEKFKEKINELSLN